VWSIQPFQGRNGGCVFPRVLPWAEIIQRLRRRDSHERTQEASKVDSASSAAIFGSTLKESRRKKRNAVTNEFLTSLNGGALTFGQLLASLRQCDEAGLAQFAATLGISRQHLHQLETGEKSVSPERAVRFARLLGQSESLFLQLALQDLANDSGITAIVQVKVA